MIARVTGFFYLLTILTGVFAQGVVSERLIDYGDATATATNILANANLFRWGFTIYMIEMAAQIITTALLYVLLEPVNSSVARVAAFLGLAGCTIKAFSRVFYIVPLSILGSPQYLNVFDPSQRQAIALLFLKVNDQGAAMALAFFGCATLLTGYLVFRSTFLPRTLGALSMIAAAGWLAFLYPPLGYRLFLYIAPVGLLGALAMIGWLLVVGVDEQRWKALE